MSILVVGASHRSAPVTLLEALAVDAEGATKLRAAALETPFVREAVVLATCNRIEIYAQVERFHGSVEDLTALLVERAGGMDAHQVVPSLYVRYDAGAVAHLFSVAAGLESMVVGEGQILGQVRDALRGAQDEQTVGAALNALFQHSLRVGKRAHSETRIDAAGRSMVSVALGQAAGLTGSLSDTRVCIVGAGSVAALAAATVRRAGSTDIAVVSRTLEHARRLALTVSSEGANGRAGDLSSLCGELAAADLVISCTGATGVVIDTDTVAAAVRGRVDRPLTLVDLALPHDVALEVARLEGVTLIGLPEIAASLAEGSVADDVAAVEQIVAEEVAAFAAAREQDRVAPTVVALRSMATAVIAAELERLFARLPELTEHQRDEIAKTMRRQADKLLHEPTVRVKEFAGRMPESSYAAALAELFALDPAAVDAVIGTAADS